MKDIRISRRSLLKSAAAVVASTLCHNLNRIGQRRHAAGQPAGYARAYRRRRSRVALCYVHSRTVKACRAWPSLIPTKIVARLLPV